MAAASEPMLDAWLHGGAATLFVLLGTLMLRQAWRAPAGRHGALFAFGIAAYALQSGAGVAVLGPWLVPLQLLSIGTPPLFWLFAAACFDDGFHASWRHAAAWLAMVALGAACILAHRPVACLGLPILSLLFVALAVREALTGRAVDLVEGRRRFRLVLVAVGALYTVVVALSEWLGPSGPPSSGGSLANAAGLFAIAFAIAFARLAFAAENQLVDLPPARPEAAGPPPDPQEAKHLAELGRLMQEQRIYREPGLGIAGLGAKLGLPEYRVRRLINQRLGQRNFSSFVNGYRLAEVKAALADPAQAAVPILTIALDAGFQSLGPFNRAFKAATGMTPSGERFGRQRPMMACLTHRDLT